MNGKKSHNKIIWYGKIKFVQILKKFINNFFDELRFWANDLKIRCYKNYVDRNGI